MSLEESIFSPAEDTTLLSSTLSSDSLMLFPANQVINNNDSELDITLKFDRIIRKFMQKWEIKGASFALMKNDRLIYSKGYGFADEEENVPMDVMHVFRIASISKLITAVAIMKLQEEGKLTLQDRVFGPEGILNDTIFSDIKDPRTTKITVENYYVIREDFLLPTVTPCFVRLRLPGKCRYLLLPI